MSKLTYLHKKLDSHVENDKSSTSEESIYHGSRSLTMKYYNKNDKESEKLTIISTDMKTFKVIMSKNGVKDEPKDMDKDAVIKMLKDKKYAFIVDYLKTQKGGALPWAKKTSKKSSKKTPKRSSKRSSRKTRK